MLELRQPVLWRSRSGKYASQFKLSDDTSITKTKEFRIRNTWRQSHRNINRCRPEFECSLDPYPDALRTVPDQAAKQSRRLAARPALP